MKMFLNKIYKYKNSIFNMKDVFKNIFDNKLFIIFLLFLLFGTISVLAGNIIVNENGIQSDNYYSSDGDEGLTQNIYCTGVDGQNYTLMFRDGLMINFTQGVIEYNESEENSSFPSTGLVVYYNLDGNSNDSTNNIDSNISGASNTASGKLNGAFDFE
jgi:hypothetical protein